MTYPFDNLTKCLSIIITLQALSLTPVFSASYRTEPFEGSNLYNELFNSEYPEMDSMFFTTPAEGESKEDNKIQFAQTHILKAVKLLNNGENQQSSQELDMAKNILIRSLHEKKNTHALNGLATIAILQSKPKLALSYVEQSLRLEDNINALKIKANLFSKLGSFNQAEQLYLQILRKIKYDLYIYKALTGIAIKQKNNEKAEYYLLEAYQNSHRGLNHKIHTASLIGRWYSQRKKFEKLLSLAKELNNKYPYEPDSIFFLASAQVSASKHIEAEKTLHKLINSDKKNITYQLLLAKLLIIKGTRKDEALTLLTEIIKNNLESPKAYVMKINYLIEIKNYDLAEKTVKKLKKYMPNSLIANELSGNIYLAQTNMQQAIIEYKKAYQQSQKTELLFKIILLTSKTDNPSQSIEFLKTELDKNDKNPIVHYYLAEIYQKTNNTQQAINHYKKVISLEPDNYLALNNLAGIYNQQNLPEAIELAKKAYLLLPNAPDIADTYAYTLMRQGKAEEAVLILERAVTQAPNSTEIQYHLAKAYSQINLREKAKKILLKILDNRSKPFKDKESAQKLLKKLK